MKCTTSHGFLRQEDAPQYQEVEAEVAVKGIPGVSVKMMTPSVLSQDWDQKIIVEEKAGTKKRLLETV